MSDKKSLVVLLVLLMLPVVYAEVGYTFYSGADIGPVCPRSTGLFADVIQNNGDEILDVSVSSSGSAAVFATTVPTGFVLMPGQIKNIYTYITPMSSVDSGSYSLILSANANGISNGINHDVLVKDCYDYSFVANDVQKNVCPCDSEKFSFVVTNNGEYSESYLLGVDGSYKSRVVLSQNTLTLAPGESKEIFAYVQSDCEDQGEYGFSVIVDPINGKAIKSQNVKFIVDACYDFDVNTERDLINMCEHSQESVQINVKNDGSTTNDYNLKVDGPIWANLDANKLQISPGAEKTVTLELVPDYGVEGSFQITFSAVPEKGNVQAVNIFNVNVKKCYDVSVMIEKDADRICNALENTYNVVVRNQGEYAKDFFVDVSGPAWASLDETSLSLVAGEEKQITLSVAPSYDVEAKEYPITISVSAKDSAKIASSDEITIETVTREDCYDASLNVEKDSVKVYYDSTATVPVVVDNRGADMASYSLDVSGTASNFVYLNPSVVEVAAGASEVVYLYIAPSNKVNNGDYSATVTVRLDDTTIMASDSVNVKITDVPQEGDIVNPIQDSTPKESLVTKFLNWIKKVFSGGSTEEVNESLTENIVIENITQEDNVSEEIVEETPVEELPLEEDIIEEINETPVIEESQETNVLLGVSESAKFMFAGEEHKIMLSAKSGEMTILLEIQSDPIYLPMDVGDRKNVDLNGDGIVDVIVAFNGFVGGKADITYKVLDEPGVAQQEETNNNESSKSGFFSSFFTSLGNIFKGLVNGIVTYKMQLLGLVIVVIVVLLFAKTNLWKSITKFFEEEIEEEKVIAGGVAEKPKVLEKKEEKKKEPAIKKEEKKKEAVVKKEEPKKKKEEPKKEEPKPEEDDDDEFIIEFDDD